jgi:hypothetical protein
VSWLMRAILHGLPPRRSQRSRHSIRCPLFWSSPPVPGTLVIVCNPPGWPEIVAAGQVGSAALWIAVAEPSGFWTSASPCAYMVGVAWDHPFVERRLLWSYEQIPAPTR